MKISSTKLGWALGAAVAAGGIGGTSPAPAQQAPARPAPVGAPSVYQIATGRGRMLTLARPMTDVFIADPGIADVQIRSPTQLYIFGKKTGETTVSMTGRGGAVLWQATVRVGSNYDSVGQMLTLAMPDAQIVATPMNGLILLTGTVANPDDAAEAERLVSAFVGADTKVLSRLKTATPLQVNLQVRFAEVSHSFAKNISANIASVNNKGGFEFGIARGNANRPQFSPGGPLATGFTNTPQGYTVLNQLAGGTTLGAVGHLLGLDLLSSLDLGETTGQVTTLANPNLTALSGETGTFLAGGEIPIPVAQGGSNGAVSVEFKEYGVSLAYTPTVLSDGRISLRVRPEVSQLSSAGSVTIGGISIPALTTRRAETTVELGSGQSFMIAGLMQNIHNNSFEKTPGAADLPILGALFRSNAWQRNETELVIVITPYLVKPVNANDIVLPTDGYKAPGDLDRVLLGTLARGTSGGDRPKPTMAPAGAPPQPALGATAPVLPAPPAAALADDDRRATENKKHRNKGAAAAAPGFSSN